MTTYWISNEKHFCDLCKCWTLNNKPTIIRHEQGRQHQEKLKERIKDLTKRATEQAKQEKQDASYMKSMESKAKAAFKKDLEGDHALAVRTAENIRIQQHHDAIKNAASDKERAELIASVKSRCVDLGDPNAGARPADSGKRKAEDDPPPSVWDEAHSPEGWTYYWHTATGEVTWVKPEGYEKAAPPDEETTDLALQLPSSSGQPPPQAPASKPPRVLDREKLEEFPVAQGLCQGRVGADMKVVLPLEEARVKAKESQAPIPGTELASFQKRNVKKFKSFDFKSKPAQ